MRVCVHVVSGESIHKEEDVHQVVSASWYGFPGKCGTQKELREKANR